MFSTCCLLMSLRWAPSHDLYMLATSSWASCPELTFLSSFFSYRLIAVRRFGLIRCITLSVLVRV